jgi:exosortase D (VPLPA-CTERM-specific)
MNETENFKHIFNMTSAVQLFIASAVIIGIYFDTIERLLTFEWRRNEFSYCYVMPFLIAGLIWHKRRAFFALPSQPAWTGLLCIAVGAFFLFLGEFGGEFFTIYLSLWFMIVGLCWVQFGWRKMRTIIFPLALLLTAFPPPRFLHVRIFTTVELISAEIAAQFLRLLQFSVFRQYNVLELEFARFEVIRWHSSLRFLIPIGIITLVIVYLFRAAWWKRALVLGLAAPLALVVNGVRTAALALIANAHPNEAVAGWVYEALGWLMVLVVCGALLATLFFWSGRPKSETSAQAAFHHAAPEPGGPGPDPSNPGRKNIPLPYVTAVAFLIGVFVFLQYRWHTPDDLPRAGSLETFPDAIAVWQGQRYFFPAELISQMNLSDYVEMEYRDPQDSVIDFYVAWYASQSKGKSIHTPETCLRGVGWKFQKEQQISVDLPGYENSPVRLNRVMLTNGPRHFIMYFWFRVRERNLVDAYELKFFNFWDRLIRRRSDGALIRVMTPIKEPETSHDAGQRLQNFLTAALPVLDNRLPD